MASKRDILVPKHTKNFSLKAAKSDKSLFDEESLEGRLSNLSVSIQTWLRKRGQSVNSSIPELQRRQIKECFDMIDTDGSGALDTKEVYELFQAMGMKLTKEQVRLIILEVDDDMSGEIEFEEFLSVMYKELYSKRRQENVWNDDIYSHQANKKASSIQSPGGKAGTANPKASQTASSKGSEEDKAEDPEKLMPLNFVASAYRRKKIIEGVMDGSSDMRSRMISSESAIKEQLKEYDQEALALERAEARGTSAFLSIKKNKIIADRLAQSDELTVDILNP